MEFFIKKKLSFFFGFWILISFCVFDCCSSLCIFVFWCLIFSLAFRAWNSFCFWFLKCFFYILWVFVGLAACSRSPAISPPSTIVNFWISLFLLFNFPWGSFPYFLYLCFWNLICEYLVSLSLFSGSVGLAVWSCTWIKKKLIILSFIFLSFWFPNLNIIFDILSSFFFGISSWSVLFLFFLKKFLFLFCLGLFIFLLVFVSFILFGFGFLGGTDLFFSFFAWGYLFFFWFL